MIEEIPNWESRLRHLLSDEMRARTPHGRSRRWKEIPNRELILAHFWKFVRIGSPEECWNWSLSTDSSGYGRLIIKGERQATNRLAAETRFGEIPVGMVCCHACDNPTCCNPKHLFLGNQRQNILDCKSKGRFSGLSFLYRGVRRNLSTRGYAALLTEHQIDEIRKFMACPEPHWQKNLSIKFGVRWKYIFHVQAQLKKPIPTPKTPRNAS